MDARAMRTSTFILASLGAGSITWASADPPPAAIADPPPVEAEPEAAIDISGYEPPISRDEARTYEKIVGMSEAQSLALSAMHDAMFDEYKVHARIHAEAAKRLQISTIGQWDERSGRTWERLSRDLEAESSRLRQAFMDDFRALLTTEQEARWPQVELKRRRDQSIGNGCMIGERVDFTTMVENLDIPPEHKALAAEVVIAWEVAIDRAMRERDAVRNKFNEAFEWSWDEEGLEAGRAQFAECRAAGKRIADLNRRFAKQIAAQLPDESASKFNEAFERACYSDVYWDSYAETMFKAVEEFTDLTDQQRTEVAAIKAAYISKLRSIRLRAKAALEAFQDNAAPQELFWGWTSAPLDRIWAERREMERAHLQRVHALLTDKQFMRLPVP